MQKSSFIKIVFICSVVALFLRLYNINYRYMPSDSGYELEAARSILLNKRLPLVGPALSVSNISIPPTYLYWISFFYLLSDNVLFITAMYALVGFLTIIFFSGLIYSLTANKKISLWFFATFSIWNYHISLSSSIWHPHPVFFFLTLSLLLISLAFRYNKTTYLLLGQFIYIVALSIYPSPIFLLPIIFLSSYYFFLERKHQSYLSSLVYAVFSLMNFWLIVYLPKIFFDMQHNLESIRALFDHTVGKSFDITKLGEHFYKIFEVFVRLFFPIELEFPTIVLSMLFVIFVCYLSQLLFKKVSYLRIFSHPLILLWIPIVLLSLRNQEVYANHRTDVFNFLFFIVIALELDFIFKLKNKIKKFLLLFPFAIFFLYFFIYNFRATIYHELLYKHPESIYMNQKIADDIVKIMNKNQLDSDKTSIFFKSYLSNEKSSIVKTKDQKTKDAVADLWFTKWQADRVEYFINKTLNKKSQLIDSMQMNLGRAHKIDYLKQDYYFLICRINEKNNPSCLDNFLLTLSYLDSQNLYFFEDRQQFYVYNYENNNPEFIVYLIDKTLRK